jgi:nitrite reductase/ring-hydroxylating ferredoxin subunit
MKEYTLFGRGDSGVASSTNAQSVHEKWTLIRFVSLCGRSIGCYESRIRIFGGFEVAEQFVAKASDLRDGDRRIVVHGDIEIGVFRESGSFFAYSNYCVHQGGPACEGLIIAKVEEVLSPERISLGMRFDENELHFVCPWHGYEYDLKTGECVANRRLKLKKYTVEQRGEDLYVIV